QTAGDRSDPALIELRRRLYEDLTRLVRGAMILPVSDGDAGSYADFFPPDLDDAAVMRRRIELIDAIASRRLLRSVRGPLDQVIEAILAALAVSPRSRPAAARPSPRGTRGRTPAARTPPESRCGTTGRRRRSPARTRARRRSCAPGRAACRPPARRAPAR